MCWDECVFAVESLGTASMEKQFDTRFFLHQCHAPSPPLNEDKTHQLQSCNLRTKRLWSLPLWKGMIMEEFLWGLSMF